MRVPFGVWAPDRPDLDNGLEECLNCTPYPTSYGPFADSVVYSSALTARAQGAVAVRDTTGVVYTFAGDATTLYKSSLTGWDDVSRLTGGAYTTPADGGWQFTQYGDTFIAVNGADAMQVYTLGTSTDFANQSASASAPVAGVIASVRDFVMAGRIASAQNSVQWCQINNPLRWGYSARNESDTQVLPSGGSVVAITGGDFATILTDQSVWRGTYVGSPLVFRFDEVAPGIGCVATGSAARYQNLTFFLSSKGFYLFDGQNAIPIGDGLVDQYFLGIGQGTGDFNTQYFNRVSSVIDPVNKLYVVSYPSVDSVDGTPDKMIIYNWSAQRWSRAVHSAELIFAGLSPGYTLEQLDAISASLDGLPFSLDSRVWMGGNALMSGFDTSHRLVTYNGSAKTATFITGESQLVSDSRAFVSAVRPLVQGSAATAITAQIGKRDRLIDSVSYTTAVNMNSSGLCPVRADARFHRVRVDISGSFSQAMGFDLTAKRSGER